MRCVRCEQALATNPMRYSSMQPRASADVHELTLATFPNLAMVYADRLAIEAQIKRSPGLLSPEERSDLILEPFVILNPAVEECFRETRFDRQSGVGCLGSLVVFALVFGISMALKEPMQGYMLMAAMSFLCIGVLYTFIQLGLGPRRRLRTRLLPAFAHSLDPLEPTMEELSACLAKCKAAGMKIGTKVKMQALWAELQERAAATTIRDDYLAR